MSVIVTGMDMPKCCGECTFKVYDRDCDSYICEITNKESDWGIGHTKEGCPLKSIDGLIEKIEEYWNECDDLLQAPSLRGTREVIKEYCEVGEKE